jgi:4-hydroxy-tetrahydrodipicolinate reductase
VSEDPATRGADTGGPPLRALIVGAGAMGEAIAARWQARGHQVIRRIGRDGSLGGDPTDAQADVAFEFTHPQSAAPRVLELIKLGVPTVCGTTGWDPAAAREAAARNGVPLLVAANFSIGIAVVKRLAVEAARALAPFPAFEPALVERHHRRKLDAPSGTAKMLAALLAEARGGAAPPVVALRHGGQPGEHTIVFEGDDESIELVHRVRSRGVFADGAVAAGEWLAAERPPGPVTFEQFLERRSP